MKEIGQNGFESWSQPCSQWADLHPQGGTLKNCLAIQQRKYHSAICSNAKQFICQYNPSTLIADRNLI